MRSVMLFGWAFLFTMACYAADTTTVRTWMNRYPGRLVSVGQNVIIIQEAGGKKIPLSKAVLSADDLEFIGETAPNSSRTARFSGTSGTTGDAPANAISPAAIEETPDKLSTLRTLDWRSLPWHWIAAGMAAWAFVATFVAVRLSSSRRHLLDRLREMESSKRVAEEIDRVKLASTMVSAQKSGSIPPVAPDVK